MASDEELGVAEGVGDALRRERVLVVAGVADQRPARAVRPAEEEGQVAGALEGLGPPAGAHALGQRGGQRHGVQKGALDVGAHAVELRPRPERRHHRAPVVGGPGDDHVARARVQLGAVEGQAVPVGVVGAGPPGAHVVGRRADGPRDARVDAVGADHDPGALGDGRAAGRAAADPRDAAVLDQYLAHREALAHLGARLGGGVDQHLVEQAPAGGVGGVGAARGRRRRRERERADVEGQAPGRGAAGRDHAVEQPPPAQALDARLVDVVRGEGVAGKAGAVHDQDPEAPARQQHRRRRAGAAGADHDRVVHRCTSVSYVP